MPQPTSSTARSSELRIASREVAEQWRYQSRWQWLQRQSGLLVPDYNSGLAPGLPTVAGYLGRQPIEVPWKAERYALGSALSGTLLSRVVTGDGPKHAQFSRLPYHGKPKDPIQALTDDMQAALDIGMSALHRDPSAQRAVGILSENYDTVLRIDPARHATKLPVVSPGALNANEGPGEFDDFLRRALYAFDSAPVEVLERTEEAWLHALREVVRYDLRRVLRFSVRDFGVRGMANPENRPTRLVRKATGTGTRLELVPPDSAARWKKSTRVADEPDLGCVADLARIQPTDEYSAAANFIYAAINAAADRGVVLAYLAPGRATAEWQEYVTRARERRKHAWFEVDGRTALIHREGAGPSSGLVTQIVLSQDLPGLGPVAPHATRYYVGEGVPMNELARLATMYHQEFANSPGQPERSYQVVVPSGGAPHVPECLRHLSQRVPPGQVSLHQIGLKP